MIDKIKMQKSKIKIEKSKGYVLVSVLVIMMIMLVITYYLADVLFSEIAISRNQKNAMITFNSAEAGIQEALWRVQNDVTTRNTFLNTTNGVTTFSHDPALLPNSSYSVTIQNTALSAATITSTSLLNMGTRQAQRRVVVNITQSNVPPPYNDDAAFFVHQPNGNATGDLEYDGTTLNVFGGSIHSNRDIGFKDATINIEGAIKAVRHIQEKGHGSTVNCNCSLSGGSPLCSANPGCTQQLGVVDMEMPMIDINSASPSSYLSQAISQNQHYSSQADFFTQTGFTTEKSFTGVVYVEGNLTLSQGRIMNMNGVLVTSGSLTIGSSGPGSPFNGVLNISQTAGQSAGALSLGGFTLTAKGDLTGTGLIFSSGTTIDSSSNAFTFTGGILTDGTARFGARVINLHFNKDVIDNTIGYPTASPVIVVNHWEEEY